MTVNIVSKNIIPIFLSTKSFNVIRQLRCGFTVCSNTRIKVPKGFHAAPGWFTNHLNQQYPKNKT